MATIRWTEYIEYRARLRGFDLQIIEDLLSYSKERYFDTTTQRNVVVGKHGKLLVMIPYDENENNEITPVTIHATSRQQVNYRIKCGRFKK